MAKKFSDIQLLSVGHSMQMAGAIYVDGGKAYLAFFPDEHLDFVARDVYLKPPAPGASIDDFVEVESLLMSSEEWQTFLRQTDLLETEVSVKLANGTVEKAIV